MEQHAKQLLISCEALLNGHFLLTSGRHSNQYIQCAKVMQHPPIAEKLTGILASSFDPDNVDVVIGPATGGMIIAYELARKLGARSLFTERFNGKMALRRGFSIAKGERVLVAEDVITTGGTVQEVIDIVKETGGELVGVCVLVDRSMGKIDFGVKLQASYVADVVSWEAGDCPLCKAGGPPAEKPGSRAIT